jgi:hypothetical protein
MDPPRERRASIAAIGARLPFCPFSPRFSTNNDEPSHFRARAVAAPRLRGSLKNAKGPPGRPDGPCLDRHPRRASGGVDDYMLPVSFAAAVSFAVMSFDIAVSFAIIASLPIVLSTAVMLSSVVPMVSVEFMSVTMVLSVVVSFFGPQAETISAAPAIIEPVTTFAMSARI